MSYAANDVAVGDGMERWERVMIDGEGTKDDDIG